jgi:DNA end-binding protein Ku
MAARSLATATVSFGLVSIPVRLYSATQPSAGISFNLLHAGCGSRLRQQYFCQRENVPVAREEMVKGYEFAKDRYVTFTSDELKALEETATQTIDIAEFVPLSSVDPVYFDKPYYLGPDRGGDKAYRLLAEALSQSGKAALARYAARGKGYLVLIRAVEGRLVMQQLLYADEVRPFDDVPVGDAQPKDSEIELALRLVEQTASSEFHPEAYRDEVRERVVQLVEQKIAGQEISAAPAPGEPQAEVVDLVEALRASLAAASREKGGGRGVEPAPPRGAPAPVEHLPSPASSGGDDEERAASARKGPRRMRREPDEESGERAAPQLSAARKATRRRG